MSEFAYSILYPKIASSASAVIAEDKNELNCDSAFLKMKFLKCFMTQIPISHSLINFKHIFYKKETDQSYTGIKNNCSVYIGKALFKLISDYLKIILRITKDGCYFCLPCIHFSFFYGSIFPTLPWRGHSSQDPDLVTENIPGLWPQ